METLLIEQKFIKNPKMSKKKFMDADFINTEIMKIIKMIKQKIIAI